jgi:hypothetical protein
VWALPSWSTKQFGEDKQAKDGRKERPGSYSGQLGGVCIVGEILGSVVRSKSEQARVRGVGHSRCS